MPSNGPPHDDDDDDKYPPPITAPYSPTGPQPFPWRGWLTWLLRGFGRSFASVSLMPLGRGLEIAAAGLLVTGVIVTWHLGAPPFAGASSQTTPACDHHCCHAAHPGGATGSESDPTGRPESSTTIRESDTTAAPPSPEDGQDRGDLGERNAAQCLGAATEGSASVS